MLKTFPELSTKRIKLTKITAQYTAALMDIMSRDEVTRYYRMDNLTSIDEARQLIDSFQQPFEQGRGLHWGIVLKEMNLLVPLG